MSQPEENSIHVSPAGESWDVETGRSTLASAASKEEALEIAHAEAPKHDASSIVVHTSDGAVEKEIPVSPKIDKPATEDGGE